MNNPGAELREILLIQYIKMPDRIRGQTDLEPLNPSYYFQFFTEEPLF
jgi:hypothetical protein